MTPSDWLPFEDPPGARLRLVCCAHSGSGIAPFARWRNQMPAGVALCPVRRPGRESTFHRPLLRDVTALVDGLRTALAARSEMPTVLLGHSLGAMETFELARGLQASGRPPRLLVVSGRNAPQHPLATNLTGLPDAVFIDAVAGRYGGIPAAIRNEPELMALMLPVLRADLAAAEAWRPFPGPRWAGPTWVVRGDRDQALDPEQVDDWRRAVDGPISFNTFPGDHFYLFDPASGFFPALRARLDELLA